MDSAVRRSEAQREPMKLPRETRLTDWFRDWRLPLRRYLLRRRGGSPADVDDIAQEVFLRLLRFDRTDLITNPQAYLYKVAANVSAEWSTRSRNRMHHSSDWLDELVCATTPEEKVNRQMSDRALTHALLALPLRHREILRLHFEEGLTYDEVAARLQLSRRIVKRDMSSAYAALRELLPADSLYGLAPGQDDEAGNAI